MDLSTHLNRVDATASQIMANCSPLVSAPGRPIRKSGTKPSCTISSLGPLDTEANLCWLSPQIRHSVHQRICDMLRSLGENTLRAFSSAISGVRSQELVGGWSDEELESSLLRIFEEAYRRRSKELLGRVADMMTRLENQSAGSSSGASKKTSTFTSEALNTLETAYARCPVLSPAENNLVASAAGITPQQVRTWFQNKRNRGKKLHGGKPATPTPGPRPVASLPKRVPRKPPSNYSPSPSASPEPTRVPRRPVRDLPRRAQTQRRTSFDPSSEITPEPSLVDGDYNSVFSPFILSPGSSCDSIAPNGGFISPFNMHLAQQQGQEGEGARHETQINICWDQGVLNVPFEALKSSGEGIPSFEFVPPTPCQNSWGSLDAFAPDAFTGFPGSFGMDDLSQMAYGQFDDASHGLDSIESILNEALSNPAAFGGLTLSGSPQFSDSCALTPGSEASALEASSSTSVSNGIRGMDSLEGDFFTVLDGIIGEGSPSPAGEQIHPIFSSASPQSRSVSLASSSSAVSATLSPAFSVSSAPTSISSFSGHHHQHEKEFDYFTPHQQQEQQRQGPGSFEVGSVASEIGHAWQGQEQLKGDADEDMEQDESIWGWTSGILPFDPSPSPPAIPKVSQLPQLPQLQPLSQNTHNPSQSHSTDSKSTLFEPMHQAAAHGFNPTMPVGQSYGAPTQG
ncbi:hypothetical protein IAR50_002468 [Cryptococcus sp. DSM 104548]